MFVVLFRHHGRPDAAGGAGRLRRRADGQGVGQKIGCEAIKHRARRLTSCRSWRSTTPALMLQPVAGPSRGRLPVRGRLCRREGLPGALALGAAAVGFSAPPWRGGSASGPPPPPRCWSSPCRSPDEAGFVLALAFIGFHVWRTRRSRRPPSTDDLSPRRLQDRAAAGRRDYARLDAFGPEDPSGRKIGGRGPPGSNWSRRASRAPAPEWIRRPGLSSSTAYGSGSPTCRRNRKSSCADRARRRIGGSASRASVGR